MPAIYKILSHGEWERAKTLGAFAGSEVDKRDGYIHFSTAEQLRETARKHFSGKAGLVVLEVDSETLGGALRWESSRGGALFPHLYASLGTERVTDIFEAPLDQDGVPMLSFLD